MYSCSLIMAETGTLLMMIRLGEDMTLAITYMHILELCLIEV